MDAPLGVRGRNSDNSMFKELYSWEPTIRLADGLERTYRWIFDEVSAANPSGPARGVMANSPTIASLTA